MENRLRHLALPGLLFASLLFAIAGISYKFFISIGPTFISFFWLTRLTKFITSFGITRALGMRHAHIKDHREFFFLVLNGLFSILTPSFFVLAIQHTTLSNAYFASYTMPAWVMVFAFIFLGEKIGAKKVFSVVLTLVGIFLIASPQGVLDLNIGIIFGLAAALSQSGDVITSRELKNYDQRTVSLYSNFIQLAFFSVVFLAFFQPMDTSLPLFAWAAVAVVGVLLGFGSSLYYNAMHFIEASVASIISLSELIFATILGFFVFGEAPLAAEFLGYFCILLASAAILVRKSDIEGFEHLIRLKRKI